MFSGSGGLRVLELRLRGTASYVAIEWPQGRWADCPPQVTS